MLNPASASLDIDALRDHSLTHLKLKTKSVIFPFTHSLIPMELYHIAKSDFAHCLSLFRSFALSSLRYLTHSLLCSLAPLFSHSFVLLLLCSHSFVLSLLCSLNLLFSCSFALTLLFSHSFVLSLICSLAPSFSHSFVL